MLQSRNHFADRLAVVAGFAFLLAGCPDGDSPEPSGDADVHDAAPDTAPKTDVGCSEDSDCDDEIPCTSDSCREDGSCQHEAMDERCNDDNPQTPVDKCLPEKGGCFHECGDNPDCDSQKGKPGELEYCKGACAEACQRVKSRAAFLFTEYKILTCGGNTSSSHVGGATIRETRVADPRFPPEAPKEGVKTKFTREVPTAGPLHPRFRLCGDSPTSTDLKFIYNHGRTVAGDPEHRGVIGVDKTDWSPRRSSDEFEDWNEKFKPWKTCHELPDGFCDSTCGNCSYVLPKLSVPFKPVHRDSQVGCDETYTNDSGPGPCPMSCSDPAPNSSETCDPDVPSDYSCANDYDSDGNYVYDVPDPMTHCPNADTADGSFCDASVPPWKADVGYLREIRICGTWPVYTGLWGHNSNADFDAAVAAWNSCTWGVGVDEKGWFQEGSGALEQVCTACGKPVLESGEYVQRPCEAETNTATKRTSSHGCVAGIGPECDYVCDDYDQDGEIDEGDKKCGRHGNIQPTCKWADFEVQGL